MSYVSLNDEKFLEGHGTGPAHSPGSNSRTRIYDPKPPDFQLYPGKLPPETDPQLAIPNGLPKTTTPSPQERYDRTPIYAGLT